MDENLILLPILQKIPLFQSLNERDHKTIVQNIQAEFFAEDYCIFEEGDKPDALYIIKSGCVRIFHRTPYQELAILGENDFFGEMGLISEQPRSASVLTLQETIAFMLKKEDFHTLLVQNAEMAMRISNEMMHRVERNLRKSK